jgi:hypothetical protein
VKKKRGDDESMERSWYISQRYDKQTEQGKCSKSSVSIQRDKYLQDFFFGADEVIFVEPFKVFVAQNRPVSQVLLTASSSAATVSHIEDRVDVRTSGIMWEARVMCRGRFR